jgi:hypothetical protein
MGQVKMIFVDGFSGVHAVGSVSFFCDCDQLVNAKLSDCTKEATRLYIN